MQLAVAIQGYAAGAAYQEPRLSILQALRGLLPIRNRKGSNLLAQLAVFAAFLLPGVYVTVPRAENAGFFLMSETGMREKRGNRLCQRLLDRAGMVGFWTEAGPTQLAQRVAARSRMRSISKGQRVILELAFLAWRLPVIGARRDYTRIVAADLLSLDRRMTARACAFLKGWAR